MKFEYAPYHKKASNEELLEDLRRVALENRLVSISMNDYKQYGQFDCSTITRRFGTWNNALELANIKISINNRVWTEQELFDNLESVWIKKGCQPVRRDMDNKQISKVSSGAYQRKYGKWSEALKSFINFINQNDIEDVSVCEYSTSHNTKRDINLRLRFKVMQRDNFKCCACGASPAKDPSVALHIDHIIPWSKGGETVEENLQTLCSKCNLGKSDLL